MKASWFLVGARLVLAGLFLYAGALKALAPAAFAADITNFRVLPPFVSGLLAVYLPWLEILAGVALFAKRWRGGAALVLAALSTVFLVALASARIRGLDIACGCFGHAGSSGGVSLWLLLRNLALMVLALGVAVGEAGLGGSARQRP